MHANGSTWSVSLDGKGAVTRRTSRQTEYGHAEMPSLRLLAVNMCGLKKSFLLDDTGQ